VRRFLISSLPSRARHVRDEIAAAHAKRDYLLSNYVEVKCEREELGNCWNWQGSSDGKGYGHLRFEGYDYRAPRLVWSIFHGPIPPGLIIRHKCDNPRCIREDHLELGTYTDNSRDMYERGRAASTAGSLHGNTRITEDIASKILEASNKGNSDWTVGNLFGVSAHVVRNIATGETWGHIPGQRQIRRKRKKLSRFVGVSPSSNRKYPWQVFVKVNGQLIHLGRSGFEVDAAIARNYFDAYHGEPLSNSIPADETFHD
jgi:HNH endonuclease